MRDRIVAGIQDKDLQKRLLRETTLTNTTAKATLQTWDVNLATGGGSRMFSKLTSGNLTTVRPEVDPSVAKTSALPSLVHLRGLLLLRPSLTLLAIRVEETTSAGPAAIDQPNATSAEELDTSRMSAAAKSLQPRRLQRCTSQNPMILQNTALTLSPWWSPLP